jgi:hypothetical protein
MYPRCHDAGQVWDNKKRHRAVEVLHEGESPLEWRLVVKRCVMLGKIVPGVSHRTKEKGLTFLQALDFLEWS